MGWLKRLCTICILLNQIAAGFAPIFPDICYHLTHYKPAAADIPV
ncbi:phage holin, lambda family, partial [Shigella flexneri]|nr:phage holin, lambda family [Shigella flexneri]